MTITQLLKRLGVTVSMSESRRIVTMGAVKLNGLPVEKMNVDFDFHPGDLIQVGKNRTFEIREEHLEGEETAV